MSVQKDTPDSLSHVPFARAIFSRPRFTPLYLNATSRCSFMDITCGVTRSECIPPGILRIHLRVRVNRHEELSIRIQKMTYEGQNIYVRSHSTTFHKLSHALHIWRFEKFTCQKELRDINYSVLSSYVIYVYFEIKYAFII